jgi:hypothetical protein
MMVIGEQPMVKAMPLPTGAPWPLPPDIPEVYVLC